jgi:hypothetical protein
MSESTPWVWRLVATMPSTNVRIGVTMVMALATGVRVVGLGWEPPTEWLVFLTGWAGLDVLQFANKRTTSTEYVQAKQQGMTGTFPVTGSPQVPTKGDA